MASRAGLAFGCLAPSLGGERSGGALGLVPRGVRLGRCCFGCCPGQIGGGQDGRALLGEPGVGGRDHAERGQQAVGEGVEAQDCPLVALPGPARAVVLVAVPPAVRRRVDAGAVDDGGRDDLLAGVDPPQRMAVPGEVLLLGVEQGLDAAGVVARRSTGGGQMRAGVAEQPHVRDLGGGVVGGPLGPPVLAVEPQRRVLHLERGPARAVGRGQCGEGVGPPQALACGAELALDPGGRVLLLGPEPEQVLRGLVECCLAAVAESCRGCRRGAGSGAGGSSRARRPSRGRRTSPRGTGARRRAAAP